MKTYIAGIALLLGIGSAQAEPTTVYFNGTAGICKAFSCAEYDVGVLPGRPFVGQFTYETFDASPNNWGGFAGEVENFTVQFEHVTLTAEDAELRIQAFNAEHQWAAVVGRLPDGGTMTIGVTSTELPARIDLLNAGGITWDCLQWGMCGFQIRLKPLPITEYTLQLPTAVSAYWSATAGANGALQFTAAPTPLPAVRVQRGGRTGR